MTLRLFVKASLAAVLALLVLAVVVTGCARQKQDDWRSPSQPLPCASDADCHGGSCTIEVGAKQGVCSGAKVLPLLPAVDAGPASPSPGPNVQPSPSDIQI
jgi:hypothetical protein